MAERVEVDLASLTAFAKSVGGLADDHLDAAKTFGTNAGTRNQVMTGSAVGFSEAASFSDQHQKLAASATAFLGEAVLGLLALSSGAQVVAFNYADTDEKNAAAQRQLAVMNRKGTPTQSEMIVPIHGRAEIPASGVRKVFEEPKKAEGAGTPNAAANTQGPPTQPADTTRPPHAPTAEERLIEKDRRMSGGSTPWTSQIGAEDLTVVVGHEADGSDRTVTISGDDRTVDYDYKAPYTHVEGS